RRRRQCSIRDRSDLTNQEIPMTRRLTLGFGLFVSLTTMLVATAVQTPRAFQTPAAIKPTGRALKIEDYYRIQTVGGLQMSPNGRWVLFNVTTRVEETNGNRAEVYVVPTDGSTK